METVQPQKFVGPVLRGMDQDIIEAMLIAIEDDNPDAELLYEDRGGYVRIHTPRLCRVTRKSLEAVACECYGVMQHFNGGLGLK